MWKNLLLLAVIVGGVYIYGLNYGLALGLPPFTPVYYINHSAEIKYGVRVAGGSDAIRIRTEGNLKKGRIVMWITHNNRKVGKPKVYRGTFRDNYKVKVDFGQYTIHIKTYDVSGTARYDWVSTKFQGW